MVIYLKNGLFNYLFKSKSMKKYLERSVWVDDATDCRRVRNVKGVLLGDVTAVHRARAAVDVGPGEVGAVRVRGAHIDAFLRSSLN